MNNAGASHRRCFVFGSKLNNGLNDFHAFMHLIQEDRVQQVGGMGSAPICGRVTGRS
jgi:hypothetical protein